MRRFIITTTEKVQRQYDVTARNEASAKAKVMKGKIMWVTDQSTNDRWIEDVMEIKPRENVENG